MNSTLTRMATAAVAALVVSVAYAGDDATSLSYISYLERYATVKPAETAEALEAQINMPILSGDRLETARGARVEIQLADTSTLWLDEFTTVDFDALAGSRDDPAERTALYLATGTAAIEIPDGALGASTLRVETSAGVVFLHRPGLYRLDIDGGRLHVAARAGLAEAPAGVGSALVRAGQDIWVDGAESGVVNAAQSAFADDFWAWIEDRRHPGGNGQTARYVEGVAGSRAAVLDSYGDWIWVASFSTWMWRPRVAITWVPYSFGRWYWTPVGWNWISYEPWGWYPFHYGSWYFDADVGWAWCWDWVWGPAWVHWIYTPGYVGWCPRGYYDWWYARHYESPSPRWTRTALDFSGRVRLRDVDPRPWTIVPADRFGDGRVDRVRVDPTRVLRGDGADGYVSSGPLITPNRNRTAPERLFADRFRTSERTVPGLDTILGRSVGTVNGRPVSALPSLRPVDTRSLVGVPVSRGQGGATGVTDDRPLTFRSRNPEGSVRRAPGETVEPGRVTPETRNRAGVVREPGRYAPTPQRVRPSDGATASPPSRAPRVERPSSPSSTRSAQPASPPTPRKVSPPHHETPKPSKPSGGEANFERYSTAPASGRATLRGGDLRTWRQEVWGGRVVAPVTPSSSPGSPAPVRPDVAPRRMPSRGTAPYVWEMSARSYPDVSPAPRVPQHASPVAPRPESMRVNAAPAGGRYGAVAPRSSGAQAPSRSTAARSPSPRRR